MNAPHPAKPFSAAPWLLLAFALLALVAALPVGFAAHERATNARAQAALVAQARLIDLFSTLRQAENSSRGYLITGNQISMGTYNMALAQAPADLHDLDNLLAGTALQPDLATVHTLMAQKMAQLAQIMALTEAGKTQAAASLVNTDLNLLTMVKLRQLTQQMAQQEAEASAQAQEAETQDWRVLMAATGSAVFGTLLLAGFVLRAMTAQTLRLQAAEADLRTANSTLEQKVAERTATLNASEARFRLLSESLPSLLYLTDAEGKTLYVNPQSCEYSGLPFEEMLEFGWTRMVHPDDVGACVEFWNASVATGQDYEIEYRLRRHDGVYRWFLDRSVPLKNPDGGITAWIGTSTDIEDRKRAEAAMANANAELELRVSERSAQLDRIFRLSSDIVTVGGFDGMYVSVNPAWERITGHTAEIATSRPYVEFIHPDDIANTLAGWAKLRAGQPAALENRYRRADGTYCWLSWRAVADVEQQRIYGVARDITAEREREEQLRQSQKMEVVGQLTGGVAHDFNNLLTVIMGSLELLQGGLAGAEPKLTRRVESAMEAARRAAALTHRLLAFSRRQPLAPKAFDVNRLLTGMSDMLHRTLGETIAVELVTGAGLWLALADANQLENAILNLAVNARDAMPEGGQLSIETQNAYLDETYTDTRADVRPGQYVQIAVTDTGKGMAPDVLEKVFEPFFTTKPAGQGTGLGLAQVYGFIKQSGGHVGVHSAPGAGSTVKLYLPRVRHTAKIEEIAASPTRPQTLGNGQTVLIVEDEAGVRAFSAEVLGEFGYHVLTAETAAQALEIFEKTPGIKMLFTDVVLAGGMNGRRLADEILRRAPATIVLFTTGYTRDAIVHHGRLDDGINFISKPFTASALAETVTKLFENSNRTSKSPGSISMV